MTDVREINLTSVNLIKKELVAAIDTAAGHLDLFAEDCQNKAALERCMQALGQIRGVLQMVQLDAAELLAEEMFSALVDLQQDLSASPSTLLDGLGTAFYVLTRYLEFVQSRVAGRPELLIPYINHLRLSRGQAPVPESYFLRCRLDTKVEPAASRTVMLEDFQSFVRRFRHMYQLGLLALLKGKPRRPAYTMMARALQRIASACAGRPIEKLWTVAGAAIGGMAAQEMLVKRGRVMVFSMLDRRLRALQKGGGEALDQAAPPVLLKECLYWLALSGSGQGTQLLHAFSVPDFGYSEAELERERASLGGPGTTAMTAVANALDQELVGVRRILSNAEPLGSEDLDDEGGLVPVLRRVSSTLQLLNFKRFGDNLTAALDNYCSSARIGGEAAEAALLQLTPEIFAVDSVIKALQQHCNIDVDEFGQTKIAPEHSHLAEAEMAVLKEAESGLALIKRALNAYAESGLDHGHIRNVSTTLNSVRGGLVLLDLRRAAAVVERLASFVDTVVDQREAAPQVEQYLEIFADAIISLEYYLGEVTMHRNADVQSLNLAVESLDTLGYPVEAG